MVIWLLGLSGSGKSYLSKKLQEFYKKKGKNFLIVDGDLIRKIFKNDLGYSLKDREKNASRISNLVFFLSQNKINIIVPVLSIFPKWLTWNKKKIKNYYQFFIDVNIEKLKKRNNKNIYYKSSTSINKNVVGLDIKYTKPKNVDLILSNKFTKHSYLKNIKLIDKLISKNFE